METNWLQHLVQPLLEDPQVGVTGATGSCESLRASFSTIPPTRRYRFLPALRRRLYQHRHRHLWKPFPRFPNPHLRTNGFAIRRRDWLDLVPGSLTGKWGGWKLESGHYSMTRQMLRRGLQVLVVDRYGQSYQPTEWSHSQTFRSGDQSHLLIADNQTRRFAAASRHERVALMQITWGPDATFPEVESTPIKHLHTHTNRLSNGGGVA